MDASVDVLGNVAESSMSSCTPGPLNFRSGSTSMFGVPLMCSGDFSMNIQQSAKKDKTKTTTMSKRAREEIPDLANKRRAVHMTEEQEAFGLITSNADDLIAALQQLQNVGSKRNGNVEQKIRDISATLLPAFKLLAENSKATHQESHAASVTQEDVS